MSAPRRGRPAGSGRCPTTSPACRPTGSSSPHLATGRRMVDEQVTEDPRYLHQGGKPVVQIWGFYFRNRHNPMTAELANRLIDFFQDPRPLLRLPGRRRRLELAAQSRPRLAEVLRPLRRLLPLEHRQLHQGRSRRQARRHELLGRRQARVRDDSGCSGSRSSIRASVGTTCSGWRRARV